jgi:hypothetical protein
MTDAVSKVNEMINNYIAGAGRVPTELIIPTWIFANFIIMRANIMPKPVLPIWKRHLSYRGVRLICSGSVTDINNAIQASIAITLIRNKKL